MKILVIATRSPYPPRDGGGVLMASTIDGLTALGHEVSVVAPQYGPEPAVSATLHPSVRLCLVKARRRSLPAAFFAGLGRDRPLSVERHSQRPTRAAVARLVTEEPFDVVHVEQPQALLQAEPALNKGLPVVMRAQNVESELWRMLAEARPAWRFPAKREARRLAVWEAAAARRVGMTLALTPQDARSFERLAPGARVRVVRMPMPADLPSGSRELPGSPAVVMFASGWFPNRDGVGWFLRDIWPGVARARPEARLHLFGAAGTSSLTGVQLHAAPDDSRDAFASGSILVVPLRIASGTRVRILEAWARGVPVVATPAAASGLDTTGGLLLARSTGEFAASLSALAGHEERARLVAEGRAALVRWHDPRSIAIELEQAYVDVMEASAARADSSR